ncbi:MAG: 2-succinyl-5-enolpyruvyl-6-hydroxy-3-cyclohexene-1-carboxylate synthase, partial [Flavobacteriales bacterium]|nr:2-succinyl-5-enolpyruvyl-6-hydroxy-3-cyclohexene-1-carboxylate synthase [Flavobacteriales bacterium]
MGGELVSKRIRAFLRDVPAFAHWYVSEHGGIKDTFFRSTRTITSPSEKFLLELGGALRSRPSGFRERWSALDRSTFSAQQQYLKEIPFCDLEVFRVLQERIPAQSDIHLANSTAARYVQLFPPRHDVRIFCNRGTSGIDGCTSTAVGAAWASGRPTTLITGDVAFCYDGNAFWNPYRPAALRVVVIDNGGGNIFRIIEGPGSDEGTLPYFETSHDRDPADLARCWGARVLEADGPASLDKALDELYGAQDELAILVVRTRADVSPRILKAHFDAIRANVASPSSM